MKHNIFKKQEILVPLIAAIVLAVIITATLIIISSLPKETGLITLKQEYFDGTVLDLGTWKGTLSGSNEYFTATLDDIDEFTDCLRKSDLYDEKLEFKNSKSPYSTVIYIAVNKKIFSIRIMNSTVMLVPLEKNIMMSGMYRLLRSLC